jgi:hypothetical protein
MKHVPPKFQYPPTELHGVTALKTTTSYCKQSNLITIFMQTISFWTCHNMTLPQFGQNLMTRRSNHEGYSLNNQAMKT